MFEEIPEANCAGRDACLNPDPFRGDPPSPPHIPCPGPVDPEVGFTPVCLAGPGLGDRLLPPPSIGSPASAASNDRRRDDRMRLGDPNGNDVCCPVWTEPKGNGGGEFLRNSPATGSAEPGTSASSESYSSTDAARLAVGDAADDGAYVLCARDVLACPRPEVPRDDRLDRELSAESRCWWRWYSAAAELVVGIGCVTCGGMGCTPRESSSMLREVRLELFLELSLEVFRLPSRLLRRECRPRDRPSSAPSSDCRRLFGLRTK